MPPQQRTGLLVAIYAIAIFAGAFLVFQVQPIIGRAILPWHGGTPAVWTTCMLFFQTALLLGYFYAHLLTVIKRVRVQGAIHIALAVAALLSLPILPDASWKPTGGGDPTLPILKLLAAHVGLPYLLLAATAPLMQAWFSKTLPGRSPYRLYALSNAGSLIALLTYPLVFEPALTVREQTLFWAAGFGLYAAVVAILAGRWWRVPEPRSDSAPTPTKIKGRPKDFDIQSRPRWFDRLTWLLLPTLSSVLLIAITNHVCQDVAVMPFLWVAPLAIYLLSFILCFDSSRWYSRGAWGLLAISSLVCVCTIEQTSKLDDLRLIFGAYFTTLFAGCMICHGELVRRKPDVRYLTEFYLLSAAGGALGGVIVAIVCPLVFSKYVELHVTLILTCALACVVVLCDDVWRLPSRSKWVSIPVAMLLAVAFLGVFIIEGAISQTGPMSAYRSFYGVLYVHEEPDIDLSDRIDERGTRLLHGTTTHGYQMALYPREATSYYGKGTGVALALARLPLVQRTNNARSASIAGTGNNLATTSAEPIPSRPLRVGIVGLGVGTLATYARPGDTYRFYEINPIVETLARERFTFLKDCLGKVDVVMGDARLTMEAELPQDYDLLVLDAFSGDAVPTHLLTREAFALYSRHLAAEGVITVHISSRHLDLGPVMATAAEEFGWQRVQIVTKERTQTREQSRWVLLTSNQAFLDDPKVKQASLALEPSISVRMWTDEYSNLLPLLR